ncbi:DUF3231 family protein [Niallia nealsonii]|uniref:Uncharacterized protein n=1 Tax=Niallia nealsonii TaxID=115979 RepID=A0A2N0YYS3_9BACI|nr:hypothetical protein CWS01_17555 [Niallia nealsonii]
MQLIVKGKELSKSIIESLSNIFHKDDILIPRARVGSLTVSQLSPSSDKMMMYCINLFYSFGLGNNAIDTTFSLRKDLPPKLTIIISNIFKFGSDVANL